MTLSFYNIKRFGLMALIGATCFIPSLSYAACSSPAGVAGEMGYNITGTNKYEYCNDTSWVPMHDTINNGLVSYWKLDETSGSTLVDSSGNGNNGTWVDGDNNDVTEEASSGK